MELKSDLKRLKRDLESGPILAPVQRKAGRGKGAIASIAIMPFTSDEAELRPFSMDCTEVLINLLSETRSCGLWMYFAAGRSTPGSHPTGSCA
jgi:hypothetical protein